ncbi:MAG: hypothetical protein M1530_04560 [Candidatus Marsarchaeota archaeon]|nr:hypothetical protein [Candidatus Marsarchaeota archaeon]
MEKREKISHDIPALGASLFFFVLLSLSPLLHAAEQAPDIDWDSLSAPLRLQNESYSVSPVRVSDQRWLFLLYVNGTPITLAQADYASKGWTARLLEREGELAGAVRFYHAGIGNLDMARKQLDAAQAELRAYNASREQEGRCLDALGLARRPCSDYESCIKSCFASLDFCQPLAQANGKAFIYQVWDYENKTSRLNDALAATEPAYESAWASISSLEIAAYNASLPAVWSASADVLAHPFSGPVCQKPFYDSATAERVQEDLAAALQWLEPVEDGRAEAGQYAKALAARRQFVASERMRENPLGNVIAAAGADNSLLVAGVAMAVVMGLIGIVGLLVWRARPKAGKDKSG